MAVVISESSAYGLLIFERGSMNWTEVQNYLPIIDIGDTNAKGGVDNVCQDLPVSRRPEALKIDTIRGNVCK